MRLAAIDEQAVWDKARADATTAVGQHFIGGAEGLIEPNNPYPPGSAEAEEYEAAFEHFVMSGLGY